MALTDRVARHGLIVGGQRTVARGTGRSVYADERRADSGGDVSRPGIARHHHRGTSRQRDDVRNRRAVGGGCSAR